MLTNDTHLMIGPLNYTYAVQKIAIQERKSVEVLDTTRSNRNFIVDSGESSHKAQIRLLFTGLDEINKGVEDNGPSGLRGLIALFKCCPIVSIENKYLSASWRNHNGIDPSIEYGPHLDENKPYSRSDIIPIAIERRELENVPDIRYSVQVTLTISLVNVNPVSESHILYYSGSQPNGGGMEHPKDAYWLKNWLNTLTKSN